MKLEMKKLSPGTYVMGAENQIGKSVVPVRMTLTSSFHISCFLVTQKLWFDVMQSSPWKSLKHRPEYREGDNFPADGVSWHDAVSFAAELSKKQGVRCALPTEAQWEYAIRGGTSTKFFWGD